VIYQKKRRLKSSATVEHTIGSFRVLNLST